MRVVLLAAALLALAGSALAGEKWWEEGELVSPQAEERVLHCAETEGVGFVWEEGQTEGRVTAFKERRYIVKVLSEGRRTITPTIGDTAGKTKMLTCRKSYAEVIPELLVCNDNYGAGPWLFNGNRFVNAFLLGTPVKGLDPNIIISHGTCAEF